MFRSLLALLAIAIPLQSAWAQSGLPGGAGVRVGGTAAVDPRALQSVVRKPTIQLARIPGLKVIQSGYSEDNGDGTRTLTFAACATNGDGSAVLLEGMYYSLATPGVAKAGTMGPYVEPGKQQSIYNSHFQPPQQSAACRRAKLTIATCAVPPGDYDLTITANATGGTALLAKAKSTIAPYASTVTIAPAAGFQVATPQTVSGKATGSCGVRPKEVRLYADKGTASVTAPVDASGQWSAPFRFRHAGADMLHAKVEPFDTIDDSYALQSVTIAPTPIEVTVSGVPASMRVGTATAVVAQVRNRDTKAALADFALGLMLGNGKTCAAVSDSGGVVHCSLMLPATATIGNAAHLALSSVDAATIVGTGTTQTLVTSAQGLVVHTLPPDLFADVLAGQQPYGVLLNNYNPQWHGSGAHLDNGAMNYPNYDTKGGQPFDIKTYHVTDNIVFYMDNILVRVNPFKVQAPARLTASVYLTPGPNGRGPAIKGFCFSVPCALIGYDDFIPDITNIKVTDSTLALDFAVVDGKVRPTLAKADATLDFTCGGISSLACGALKTVANDKIREQLKNPPMIGATLQRVGANMDKALAGWLPVWKIKTLTSISFDDSGAMTVAGTPLTQ